MLSAQKTRQHGMKDARWVVKDKLTQYKGLINLYTRDRKIIEFDSAAKKKKQSKRLDQLRKAVIQDRLLLHNTNLGNRQLLRNILSENKEMQLAYQNLHHGKVIDHLVQDNFTKRKELDRLLFEKKQRADLLVQLRLEESIIEEKLMYEKLDPTLVLTTTSRNIAGKVKGFELKQRAAYAVGQTYRSILHIIKKDSIYFDAILIAIKQDAYNQAKCLLRTTEIGQLATEYLDDRAQEFELLKRTVRTDLGIRNQSLKTFRAEVLKANNRLKYMLRKENQDDYSSGKIEIKKTLSELELEKEIVAMQNIFEYLKKTTFVSNYQCIVPCFVEQNAQNARLRELSQKIQAEYDMLLNKKNQADTMCSSLVNTMTDDTVNYIDAKKKLLTNIEEQKQLRSVYQKKVEDLSKQFTEVRNALQNLHEMCKPIRAPKEKIESIAVSHSQHSLTTEELAKESIKLLIKSLEKKLDQLVNQTDFEVNELMRKKAFRSIETMVANAYSEKVKVNHKEDVVFDLPSMECVGILTRQDIKERSSAIVEACKKSISDVSVVIRLKR